MDVSRDTRSGDEQLSNPNGGGEKIDRQVQVTDVADTEQSAKRDVTFQPPIPKGGKIDTSPKTDVENQPVLPRRLTPSKTSSLGPSPTGPPVEPETVSTEPEPETEEIPLPDWLVDEPFGGDESAPDVGL